jgi:tRNA-2-methylthio-N6-dimethylallyladenosine synthase
VFSLFGGLKPLKQANPDLILGVAGCLAQQEQTVLMNRIPHLDFIVGPDAVESIQQIVHRVSQGEGPVVWTEFDSHKNYSIPEQPLIKDSSPSAFVNIIKGCDKFCSFCVVPYTRGREKSREAEEIYAEIRQLIDKGAKEIVLLGQNVNAYGKRGLQQPVAFHELLYGIADIEGVERLRFITSHPMDFTRDLIYAYRDIDILMNHLHLPVQSGSNRVLEMMRRSHTVEWYTDLIAQLKSEVPDIALSTDIIVGFPGETRQEFEETLKLMEQVRFNSSYMFSYSPRPNTPALEMVDDIPQEEKQERLQQTIQLQNRLTEENGQAFLGQEVEVLIENVNSRKGMSFKGRNPHYWSVVFKGGEDCLKPGDITRVRVEDANCHVLRGSWAG